MELQVGVMNYEWGKIGSASEVARLYKGNDETIIDESLPYAELWMGTHPNCPSHIKSTGMKLSCFLQNHPEMLGDVSLCKFGHDLPFLFKVLSVNKALSIQVHPDKQHAEKLYKERPNIYKDPNHKPELAIALTDFKAMCGFRPFREIQDNFRVMFEVKNVVGEDLFSRFLSLEDQKTANIFLPACFCSMMTYPADELTFSLQALIERLGRRTDLSEDHSEIFKLIAKLNEQFPNDVGCFSPIFLNVLNLVPGEAIFLGANEIHAYLEGDCVECMASSDNVIRAGLTPKFKDVHTLCSMLNYDGIPGDSKIFKPIDEGNNSKLFKPPVEDFAVAVVNVAKGDHMTLIQRNVASIVIFIKGYAHTHDDIICEPGTVLFVPANTSVDLVDVKEDAICYIGLANL